MFRSIFRDAVAVLAAAAVVAVCLEAGAVPFNVGFQQTDNHDHAFAQGFSPSVRANPDPFTDPMLGLDDVVPLDRFRVFKSDYEFESPPGSGTFEPLVATNFQLAIVDNYFLDLSTFTTSSPQLIGLSTNTVATTATLTGGTPMDFLFDSIELTYAVDYAAIFVHDDGAGNLAVVDVPVTLVTHVDDGSGVFLPVIEYGDPEGDFQYSASNTRNGNFLQTFHPPFADISFIAFFDEPEVEVLAGDYNNDTVVDAADYTVWRNNEGASLTLPGEKPDAMTPDFVDEEDYAWWKLNYGTGMMGSGGLAGGTTVPEPGSLALAAIVGLFWGATGRRRG